MKLPLLFLTLLVCAAPVAASQTTFCLKLRHASKSSTKEATCTVKQMLNWDDHRSFWTCDFTGGATQTAVTRSDSVGYDYDKHMSFTQHRFSKSSDEGSLLFANLGLEDIADKHVLKIYYGHDRPFSYDNVLMFTDSKGKFYSVELVTLVYGEC